MKRILAALSLLLVLTGCATQALPPQVPITAPVHATLAPITPAPSQAPTAPAKGMVESYFTKANDHPEKALIGVIDGTTHTLDIAIYSLTHPDIVKAILNAHKRGVQVRIITDHTQAGGKSQTVALRTLRDAGIPVKENTHSGLMHLKVTIGDRALVTTGSFNYSGAASTTNDEVLVIVRDPGMAQAWTEQFERMWSDTAGFSDLKQQPPSAPGTARAKRPPSSQKEAGALHRMFRIRFFQIRIRGGGRYVERAHRANGKRTRLRCDGRSAVE